MLHLILLGKTKGKKEVMTLYKEKTSPIKEKILRNMYKIYETLSQLVNSDNYVKLEGEGHAVNLTEDIVMDLIDKEREVREAVKEFEWYFKIYPNKTLIEEDIIMCAETIGLLDELNLKENVSIGKINKDGVVEF